MLEMNVFVGLGGKPDITVHPDLAAAHSGDEILWHVHCLDDNVSYVEIDFQDLGDKFFQSRSGTTDSNKCYAKLRGAKPGKHGNLLGVAPDLGGPGAKENKYSVRAYDKQPASGVTPLYQVDPTIVTVDP